MNILVLGAPGSGKSTQARFLSKLLGVPFSSMGEVLRDKANERSSEGEEIRQMLEKGELVDDKTFLSVFEVEISKAKYKRGVVFDGLPRTLEQARNLGDLIKVDKVIYLDVPDDVALGRLIGRGRADDTQEVISHRLKVYHEETEPVLKLYRNMGILLEVDGIGSVEEIFGNIERKMKSS